MMDAGKLDRKIEIWYNAEGVKNSFGEAVKTPTLLLTAYAQKNTLGSNSDKERFTDSIQVIAEGLVEWVIRYTTIDIKSDMWVEFGGAKYSLVQPTQEVGRKRFLKLITKIADNV